MILILFMTLIYKTMGDSGSWMFGSPQNGTLAEEVFAATERPVLKLEIEPLNPQLQWWTFSIFCEFTFYVQFVEEDQAILMTVREIDWGRAEV